MTTYQYDDGIVITDDKEVAQATFVICDDCREAYQEPAYYTFESSGCLESIGDVIPKPHVGCTGNLCPSCADMLEPDDEDDPRKQEVMLVWNKKLKRQELISKGVR